jgi:hypothetical protein
VRLEGCGPGNVDLKDGKIDFDITGPSGAPVLETENEAAKGRGRVAATAYRRPVVTFIG